MTEEEIHGAGAIAQAGGVAAGRGGIAITGDGNVIGDDSTVQVVKTGRDVFIHYQPLETALTALFGTLRREVATQAPPGTKTDALDKIDDLEQALQDENPDFGIMRYVQEWFKSRVPTLVGALTSVMLHPTVRDRVEKQRDVLQEEIELHRRNLHELEKRVARYGPGETPMHLVIQVDSEERAIGQLESLLGEGENPLR